MTRLPEPDLDDLPLPPLTPPVKREIPQPVPRRRRDDDLPEDVERGPDGRLRTRGYSPDRKRP